MGLLSLEHASGRGLFPIRHRPSVPTGGRGSDALPELAVNKDYLVVFELYRRSLIALRIDSHTDPSSQKKQHRVWLILRSISERQVYSAVRWMWRNAGIKLSNFLSFTEYKWQVWLTWPFLFYILLCKSYSSTFQCIAINLHFNTKLSLGCARCCKVGKVWSVNHTPGARGTSNH